MQLATKMEISYETTVLCKYTYSLAKLYISSVTNINEHNIILFFYITQLLVVKLKINFLYDSIVGCQTIGAFIP